ncbi:MAG: hypothetical protein LQ344_005186 [Seirophora lacunosa]|nr:MAG: hypothetical protein LQ344_005186 [Seirophora lacunosa]
MTSLEPVASPPPPYSPRRHERDGNPNRSPRNLQGTVSPSDTVSPATDPSQYGTPVSAATTMSPDLPMAYGSYRSPPPTGMSRAANSGARASTTSDFPPPPPASSMTGSRIRSSSKSHAERLLSTLGSRAMSPSTSQPSSAMDILQATTAQALAQAPEVDAELSTKPPASRRAASTGGIGFSAHSSRTTSRSPSQTRWEPGMPLPPPPPGPPPATARSQSLNRSSGSPAAEHISVTAPRSRRPPGNGTALAPVPPTPADWREELPNPPVTDGSAATSRLFFAAPLHIDTGAAIRNSPSEDEHVYTAVSATPYSAHVRQDPSSGHLARSPAVRNRSAKGIRERRSESRSGKGRATEISADIQSSTVTVPPESLEYVKPTDLVLPTGSGSFSRRRTASRISPASGKSMWSLDETLRSPPLQDTSEHSRSLYPSNTTPQPDNDRSGNPLRHITPTPPFSPSRVAFAPGSCTQASPALAPRSLPTPPPQQLMGSHSSSGLDIPLVSNERPISHLLHMPNADGSIQEPLQPAAQAKRKSMTDLLGPERSKAFAQRAIERHRNFAEREANASNDSERLEHFVRFIVAESRIRREQYAAVFEEEAVSVADLTQGLFERPSEAHSPREIRHAAKTAEKPNVAPDSGASSISDSANESHWHRSSSVASRTHESPISISTDCSSQNRPESSWWNDYIPSLSPIASMSAVTGQDRDEMGSRGRASSRWWEDKSGGSAAGDAFSVLKKSKRESKYMGLPREARDLPGLAETTVSRTNNSLPGYGEGPSHSTMYGSNEYPPEKVEWHQQSSPLPPPPPHPPTPLSAPFTPDPRRLDISRFVTLPPPYPRHHPAVNNNHPDLAEVRAVVRSLHQTEDVDAIRASYDMQITEKRKRADSWRQHQRFLHDQDIRFRMDHEELSQHQFDQAQSELDAKVQRSAKEMTQTDFDLFQNLVVSPLHALFAERITKANSTMETLSGQVFSDAQKHSPNLPQEEGDEQPELLEKLTQLKWLFEARESLHRKTYDLLSERNEKYRAIVLLPYQQSNKPSKSLEAESFFANDAHDRLVAFQQASLARYETFLGVIEANVTRGVEMQISAFWDIAPPLHRVLSRVPQNLEGFEVQIPADEYAENPDYYKWPLQYLYSLLGHAQKSTYQFIESQINLFCLLHEIKNAAATASFAAQEARGSRAEDDRRKEEARLTADLKDKVGVVERQWEEALGEELMSVRERVRCWLLENGGWDDENDESIRLNGGTGNDGMDEVNLSGRKGNPFTPTPSSGHSPSVQTTQSTVAHAQAERALRHQERRRPPAATAIQRSWRGYRDRRKIAETWRRDWDAWEETHPSCERAVLPYQTQVDCLNQLQLLIHFASPREPSDMDRLRHFARRYQNCHLSWLTACPSNEWIFPLFRLGKLSIAMLQRSQPPMTPDDTGELLRLLYTLAGTIPEQMAMYSEKYFEALGDILERYRDGPASQTGHQLSPNLAIVALLRPITRRTGVVYESFARHVLCRPDLPDVTLRMIQSEGRIEDLALALNNSLSRSSSGNLLQTKSAEELLWLIAYFIRLHRSTESRTFESAEGRDAMYVTVLSRFVSHLAGDISSRIDPPPKAVPDHSEDSTSQATPPPKTLPPFVRHEILTLISQDHVSGLLAQAAASAAEAGDTFAVGSNQTSHLAVYALTLLRAFPKRGDEIRMWLYLGSTSRQREGLDSSVPAIKYYYNAASQTSVYKLISDEPSHAIGLLNPHSRRRTNTLPAPDRNEQWQIILLFFELYPIVLKVMDDEEFLGGALSSDPSESWTRRSALSLDQVKDLTVFLKNLSFCMYWNASEIAGVEEPENKNSIAEYFSGNLSAIHDHHPDAKSTKPQDAVIAGLPGMTMRYMKGMVTGLLRMIYERDSRRRFLPGDHWLMTKWFEMDRFIPAVVQEEEEKHKIQESYGADAKEQADDDADDGMEEDEAHDTLIGTQRTQQVRNIERLKRQQRKASRRKYLESVTPRLEILQNMPFFIPFATRVQIFRHFVLLDQVRRRGSADADMWLFRGDKSSHRAKVHRESIFDDAFDQFYKLNEGLKEPIQITFVDKFGTVEEGIDGGGVTKEFLTSVTNEAFNSMHGLDMFVENDQHLLYPNPTAVDERKELLRQAGVPDNSPDHRGFVRDLLQRFEFMGRIIGKCLYEGILVDIHFAPFFLLKWSLTGGHSSAARESAYRANLNDLRDLDEALYQGLLQLKNYKPDDMDSLALTFEITDTLFPADRPSSYHPAQAPIPRTIELRPNGSNIPVTSSNRLVYISYLARHRLSVQPFAQTSAFLKGLSQIISPAWLSMFNQHELQTLVSGSAAAIDLADLRAHTAYGGLYVVGDDGQEHPTIRLFWQTVRAFSDRDKMQLLRFVTATPRAPLLGFAHLNPRFSVRDGGSDQSRLPTTSTCVNLLKLPVYKDQEVLRERLLYSINSGAGFDLS